jgi:hypothetical protein
MYVLLYCGVCTGVRLLPPGENPTAVRNNNNNNNHKEIFYHATVLFDTLQKYYLRIVA